MCVHFIFNTFTYAFVYHFCFGGIVTVGIKVPIAYANATDLSGWISSILFSISHLHHLGLIFYLLIWDLFFIKDLERNDINHTNGQEKAIIWVILQTIYIYSHYRNQTYCLQIAASSAGTPYYHCFCHCYAVSSNMQDRAVVYCIYI